MTDKNKLTIDDILKKLDSIDEWIIQIRDIIFDRYFDNLELRTKVQATKGYTKHLSCYRKILQRLREDGDKKIKGKLPPPPPPYPNKGTD